MSIYRLEQNLVFILIGQLGGQRRQQKRKRKFTYNLPSMRREKGTAWNWRRYLSELQGCQGSGQIIRYPCVECQGTGRVVDKKVISIAVPPGVEDGQTLRVSVNGVRGFTSQEIFVTFNVERSQYFRRDGADIHSDITISLAQASLGGQVRVPGIHGQMLVN
ncbi:unnamed protein product [Protopolystoma xenopodis]|uniref:Chaperone DnaJ C-terminal domain-containing protein n=1 Tax=Protopolystoma xenopodis TaxID=117903 RepID=A0A448WW95_9PLAT|nr:unnamed protein product [Protopolystoma xenopodis]